MDLFSKKQRFLESPPRKVKVKRQSSWPCSPKPCDQVDGKQTPLKNLHQASLLGLLKMSKSKRIVKESKWFSMEDCSMQHLNLSCEKKTAGMEWTSEGVANCEHLQPILSKDPFHKNQCVKEAADPLSVSTDDLHSRTDLHYGLDDCQKNMNCLPKERDFLIEAPVLQETFHSLGSNTPSGQTSAYPVSLKSSEESMKKKRRESKYIEKQPLYQNYWVKNAKTNSKPEKVPFRLDASLSIAGLVTSSVFHSSSSHISPKDSSYSFWQDIPEVKSRGLLDKITVQQHLLQEATFEVITSEASYLRSLNVVVNHFKKSRELSEVLCSRDRHTLFSNIQEVKDASESFLLELEEHLEKNVFLTDISKIVLKHCPPFRKVYVPYVTNQMYQEQLMQQLGHGNMKFLQVLRKLEEQPLCQRQLLKSFLVLPFQRITRLKLLLENILKLTVAATEPDDLIRSAIKAVGEIVLECNDNVRKMKQTEELVRLETRLEFPKTKSIPLISRDRWLVREGELAQIKEVSGGCGTKYSMEAIYLHLFNDLLLLSRKKVNGKFSVVDYAKTCRVKADHSKTKSLGLPASTFLLCLSKNHEGSVRYMIVKAMSEYEKDEWIASITAQGEQKVV